MTLRRKKAPRRASYTGPNPVTRLLIGERCGGHCERCAATLAIGGGDPHHRRPRQMGGSRDPKINLPSNLAVLCRPCHDHIESHRARAIADGWLIPHNGVPASVWVKSGLHGRVLFTDDGKVVPFKDGAS